MNFPFHFLSTLEATTWRLSRSRAGTKDSSWRHHRIGKNDWVGISEFLERKSHNSQSTTPRPAVKYPQNTQLHRVYSSINYTQACTYSQTTISHASNFILQKQTKIHCNHEKFIVITSFNIGYAVKFVWLMESIYMSSTPLARLKVIATRAP